MLYKSFYGHIEFHNAKSWEAYTIEHYGFVIYGKWAVCGKLMSFLSVTFTGLDKHTSLLCDLYFTHPLCFLALPPAEKRSSFLCW